MPGQSYESVNVTGRWWRYPKVTDMISFFPRLQRPNYIGSISRTFLLYSLKLYSTLSLTFFRTHELNTTNDAKKKEKKLYFQEFSANHAWLFLVNIANWFWKTLPKLVVYEYDLLQPAIAEDMQLSPWQQRGYLFFVLA